jgi:UDP:flavonoid glycosyltransferase YjiC (YdhE family)
VRALFAFAAGRGHLEPLLPLAWAALDRGDAVAFTGRPRMRAQVEELGFPFFAAGSDHGLSPVRRPLAPVDAEREARLFAWGFGGRIAQERARDLPAALAAWRPDVVVCDETDFGAMLAAEEAALPFATVLVTASGRFVRPELVAPLVDAARAARGLAPDPALAAVHRHLVLSPFPERLRPPGASWPPGAHAFRAVRAGAEAQADGGGAEAVYVTLGTVFGVESGDLLARVIAALRELGVRAIVTVGNDVDPAELGAPPPNVSIERFVPQAEILPRCRAVVSHAGSGSVLGALAHGLPMLLLPLGADQPLNAARCEAIGAARVLDAVTAAPHEISAAIAALLESATHRGAAEAVRHEIATMPEPEAAIARVAKLAERNGAGRRLV